MPQLIGASATRRQSRALLRALQGVHIDVTDLLKIDQALALDVTDAERACLVTERLRIVMGEAQRLRHRYSKAQFMADTTTRARVSRPTLYRDLRRGRVLGTKLLESIVHTSLDHAQELDALMLVTPDKRDALVANAIKGKRVSAKRNGAA